MNTEQAQGLLENKHLLEALAAGKPLHFPLFNCNNRFVRWYTVKNGNLSTLARGGYTTKRSFKRLSDGRLVECAPPNGKVKP